MFQRRLSAVTEESTGLSWSFGENGWNNNRFHISSHQNRKDRSFTREIYSDSFVELSRNNLHRLLGTRWNCFRCRLYIRCYTTDWKGLKEQPTKMFRKNGFPSRQPTNSVLCWCNCEINEVRIWTCLASPLLSRFCPLDHYLLSNMNKWPTRKGFCFKLECHCGNQCLICS